MKDHHHTSCSCKGDNHHCEHKNCHFKDHNHHHGHGNASSCGCDHHHEHHHNHDNTCSCRCDHHHEHHHNHDDGCGCGHNHGHADAERGRTLLLRVGAAVILMLLGFLTPAPFNVLLFAAGYLAAGYDVLLHAAKNIARGRVFDENFLMTVASLGAMCMGDFAEGVAVMGLYQVGEYFQDKAVDKSRASIAALMDIRPESANLLLADGSVHEVSPEAVQPGDTILVKPGERIPLDGRVLKGSSALDTAALTGESIPRDVQEGDTVLSGCVSVTGMLTVEVTSVYRDSTVARILNLVENSGQAKAQTERFITRFARVYTPLVCLAALLLTVIPSLFDGQWLMWLRRALTFLVISCPCALVISVPLTFFSGIGAASRKGILIKGANHLETLSRLRAMVFDKTGTLTKGVFTVTEVHPASVSREELLETAALAESWSEHPISLSLQHACPKPIDRSLVTSAEDLTGRGVRAEAQGHVIHAGNARLMAEIGVNIPQADHPGTVVHVAQDSIYLGCIVISDVVKETSARAMAELKEAGVARLIMLTGDRQSAADAAARELGLTEVHAQLLPADKVERMEQILREGSAAFCGDGINDAPVLRRSDVGIAMGALGSDAAIEAADVVLMDDDPLKLPLAIRIARRTMSIARQNIVFALGVKLLVMLLGALGIANMWLAVFADVGVAMLAILNAMRALHIR